MASALQCPACGQKHRLSGLTGDPIFSCVQCGRLLKTPPEFRRPEPSGPAGAPPPSLPRVQRGGAATADRTGVMPTPTIDAAGAASSGATRPPVGPRSTRDPRPASAPRPKHTISEGTADLPLRILAWVLAFVVGAYLVRFVARITGVVNGDTMIDLLTGSGGWFRYVRIAFIIPVWALFSAGLATLFIEGTRAALRRRAALRAQGARAPAPAPRPPARRPAPAPGAAARPVSRAAEPTAAPGSGEARSPSGAPGQRARRIPRRDVTS